MCSPCIPYRFHCVLACLAGVNGIRGGKESKCPLVPSLPPPFFPRFFVSYAGYCVKQHGAFRSTQPCAFPHGVPVSFPRVLSGCFLIRCIQCFFSRPFLVRSPLCFTWVPSAFPVRSPIPLPLCPACASPAHPRRFAIIRVSRHACVKRNILFSRITSTYFLFELG